ncbi:DnaJ domain-containing protein [Planktothrix sp. FACHB-1355]|uniref:DnaJ domain-containing protein n=1 Tax=Aerosakkonema funiforme FACHB-1375 TaxID=2949571 RepID=A0A926ZKE4_9CYAN|nr:MULTISPECIES: DnaJ domain-containing protein [Oscillatoriales]MBD2185694.1 DnaJ domain-containing protein [Aerosakkonema funiforme FACHB-1375]MBD3561929.1 DnaJ domain-containing protein [Planktothrix sp. FACHB-1355]
MALNIERGLFKFDFTDHHAVLGVPLDATANDVRKRYLKISRRLHPDSCIAESEAVKHQASQFFAKMVNPAYEQLFSEQSRAEHNALLSRMGKRLVQEQNQIEVRSEIAKKLSKSGNFEQEYKTVLQNLSEKQYESLDKVLEQTAEISEINLIYLLRKASQGQPVNKVAQAVPKPQTATAASGGTTKPPAQGTASVAEKKVDKQETSPTETYCRRALEYIEKNYPARAVLEMKDALKMEPNNSRCHAILAMAYWKQDQMTMAKVHMNQALKFNPQEPTALEVKKLMEKLAEKSAAATASAKKKEAEKSSGGLFGLFGKKTDKNEKKK